MKRKTLLLGLATLFLLFFYMSVRFNNEQSTTADVPSPVTLSEETQSDDSVFYEQEPIYSEEVDEDPVGSSGENTDSTFTFMSNPSSEYFALNPDYVGWIETEGTVIDYPVVRGQDNEFYLEHDFYKDEHILGAIFMDYRNIGMGLDDHTILYGHYTKSGLMFAELEKYLSEEFTAENETITFQDPYTDRTYKIFSVHVSPADSRYIKTSFKDNELEEYYEALKGASAYPIEDDWTPEQKLLTLISCNYTVDDGRIYVHAYEVTE